MAPDSSGAVRRSPSGIPAAHAALPRAISQTREFDAGSRTEQRKGAPRPRSACFPYGRGAGVSRDAAVTRAIAQSSTRGPASRSVAGRRKERSDAGMTGRHAALLRRRLIVPADELVARAEEGDETTSEDDGPGRAVDDDEANDDKYSGKHEPRPR